jgi:5,10-methylenetetrahydromethanopterin reductase
MKFGVVYQSFDPPDVFLDYVRLIEALGFDELWVCDSSLHARDVFAYLTLAAANTKRLKLGVSVFQPYTRHPAINVNGMATINEISNGRAMMAVGAGDRPQLELGFKPAPVQLVRDMISVSRGLLKGQSVTFTNAQFQLVDARIRSNTLTDVPIYVACSGPKMLQMAGECADGVLMMCGASPETISFALDNVKIGLRPSGRHMNEADIAWGAATVIADDTAHALDQTRVMAAWYANHSPHYVTSTAEVDMMRRRDPGTNLHEARAAAALAPDDMVDQLALAGPPRKIIDRLDAARALGINHFVLFLIGPEKRSTLERFAADVMPALE